MLTKILESLNLDSCYLAARLSSCEPQGLAPGARLEPGPERETPTSKGKRPCLLQQYSVYWRIYVSWRKYGQDYSNRGGVSALFRAL